MEVVERELITRLQPSIAPGFVLLERDEFRQWMIGLKIYFLLAFQEQSPQTGRDLMMPVEGDETSGWKPGKASVFLASPAVLDYRIIVYFLRLLNPTSAA